MKKRILIDMDGVICDLITPWFEAYNKDYQDNLLLEDLVSWDTPNLVKKECGRKIFDYWTHELFLSLKPIKGAISSIAALVAKGHEVVIVTSPPFGCANAKYTWLKKHLPFIPYTNIIMASKKHLLQGDVFIDDSPKNVKNMKLHNPLTHIYCPAYKYNDHVSDSCLVYEQPDNFWEAVMNQLVLCE